MKAKLIIFLAILLTIVAFSQCEREVMEAAAPDSLKRRWVHSFEEDEGKEAIFRPHDYHDFPVSRFRFVMELKDRLKCSFLVLAANDAHYLKEGTWEYNERTKTIKVKNGSDTIYEYLILELGDDILRVKGLD